MNKIVKQNIRDRMEWKKENMWKTKSHKFTEVCEEISSYIEITKPLINFDIVMSTGRVLKSFNDDCKLEIAGHITESHKEGNIRIIDDLNVMGVSFVPRWLDEI